MYSNKLVVAIKVNGQILRENGDTVSLPFGSEYSVLIKNLDSVRSQVTVSVDGQNATEGTRLIIPPNSSVDLERFIRNGNLQSGNRFKFIERTGDVEKHRGVGTDDGLVRVEGWREHIQTFVDVPIPRYYDEFTPLWPRRYPRPRRPFLSFFETNAETERSTPLRPGLPSMAKSARSGSSLRSASLGHETRATASASDIGITVPGSESSQQFNSVAGFPLESQSVVIVLRLRGEIGGAPVATPITVNVKLKCMTCGRSAKSDRQFCDRCGTALKVI